MASPRFILMLLVTGAFTLSTVLARWHSNWSGGRYEEGSFLNVLMGDSRRIFANHFFTKADVYFHSGYYPSIFDGPKQEERAHMEGEHEEEHVHNEHCDHGEEEEHHEHDENCDHDDGGEGGLLGKPRDIIDAFGRNFYVTAHTHLGAGDEREMLPWLKIAAELDPYRPQSYTVASYWLRTRLNKPAEAEAFLREGWRLNPDSYEILFELGRIYREHHKDTVRARNLWELALAKWRKQAVAGLEPDLFNYQQILVFLGTLEEEEKNYAQALRYFEALKEVSPTPERIEKRIEELKSMSASK